MKSYRKVPLSEISAADVSKVINRRYSEFLDKVREETGVQIQHSSITWTQLHDDGTDTVLNLSIGSKEENEWVIH